MNARAFLAENWVKVAITLAASFVGFYFLVYLPGVEAQRMAFDRSVKCATIVGDKNQSNRYSEVFFSVELNTCIGTNVPAEYMYRIHKEETVTYRVQDVVSGKILFLKRYVSRENEEGVREEFEDYLDSIR